MKSELKFHINKYVSNVKLKSFRWILVFFAVFFITPCTYAMDVNAKAAVLIDADSKQAFFEKNADLRLAPASITKIMTAYIILDELKKGTITKNTTFIVSHKAASVGESSFHLKAGEKITVNQMITSILVASANDSCIVAAEGLYGSEAAFINKMNQKAKEIGLQNTHFLNTNGLPDGDNNPATGHYMSARDIAVLASSLIKNHPEVLVYSDIENYLIPERHFEKENTNKLLKLLKEVDGLKTGYTKEAGYCLVSTLKIPRKPYQHGINRIIGVVLGTNSDKSRVEESKKLLLYGKNMVLNAEEPLKKVKVLSKEDAVGRLELQYARKDQYSVYPKEDLFFISFPKDSQNITKRLHFFDEKELIGVKAGEEVGYITLKSPFNDDIKIPLVVNEDIKPQSLWKRIIKSITQFFKQF